MSKYTRHQPIISRQSESSEDHWLRQFEDKLQKTSVQPRNPNLIDEINSIMNNTSSRYPSVQAAVDDMMQRSGLTAYLDKVVTSEDNTDSSQKVAQAQQQPNQNTPEVIKEKPSVLNTLENIIKGSKGNIPVPAIISRLRSLHARDIADESVWEDEKLIRLVSQMNLKAKKDNPSNYDNYSNLGESDHVSNSDIDPSNTDAFNILMPAKV